ncbi:MAG: FAD-binding protein, partial [Desulfatitalea sp.]|nr:FAD-binding protein [Desulfatitalea sp.]
MKSTTCDVIIIGTGMSGMAAALFAARYGLDTALVGQTGELGFASGLLDLLGVHPVNGGAVVADPWQGIAALQRDAPQHPYARMRIADIREAFRVVLDFLKAGGYPYTASPHANQTLPTPVGTLKTTYAVPHTMAHGPAALANRTPCLLVDIDGLKGYSARQITAGLADRWPGLRPVRISFP